MDKYKRGLINTTRRLIKYEPSEYRVIVGLITKGVSVAVSSAVYRRVGYLPSTVRGRKRRKMTTFTKLTSSATASMTS